MNNANFWHAGFLTPDVEATINSYCQLPGVERVEPIEIAFDESEMRYGSPLKVKVANLMYKGMLLELIQPVDCPDSFMATELERKGPGMHHMAYELPGCYLDVVDELIKTGWVLGMAACKGGINNCFLTSPDGAVILELVEKIPG